MHRRGAPVSHVATMDAGCCYFAVRMLLVFRAIFFEERICEARQSSSLTAAHEKDEKLFFR